VFALGAMLAGLGGALQLPREPASLELDINTISAAFVVVVVGGMGSITGAFAAALLIAELKAICIWIGLVNIAGIELSFSKMTLVVEFLVMAVVLVVRPWGLLGRATAPTRNAAEIEDPLRPQGKLGLGLTLAVLAALVALPFASADSPYVVVLAIDLLVAALFAASLHFIMGPGGMASFGHAAYFGLAAYGAALLVRKAGLPMELSLVGGPLIAMAFAVLFGWFAVRLSGVYLAMLTLAFAQIAWAIVYQWDSLTGGSNGVTGVWPSAWLSDKSVYYAFVLVLVVIAIALLRRILFSPFGYAMRAGRDSPLRADAIGIDVKRVQWVAFVIAGGVAGIAGALFAFSKGSISPEGLHVGKSIDALVMVLLGGVQTLAGPLVGAVSFTWLHDTVARNTEYWRAMLGGVILVLVLLFPEGIAGYAQRGLERLQGVKR
jgi:branched-chain amino acid transport system permease protein